MAAEDLDLTWPDTEVRGNQFDHSRVGRSVYRRSRGAHYKPAVALIAEAMACGRPVIAAESGGARELYDDGRSALGVAPGDASGLARALLALSEDAERRRQLGAAARATAVERFDRRRLGVELAGIYEKAVRGARARS